MKKSRILITGGTGFIGLNLLAKLSRYEFDIMVLCREIPNYVNFQNIQWCKSDLEEVTSYTNNIKQFKPSIVIHLSWTGIPEFDLENSQKNLINSINFFDFLFDLNCLEKIIVSGSCWEYGQSFGECFEKEKTTSKNFFTWSKHSLRMWLETECMKNSCCLSWLRLFYVYGPGQRKNALIPSLIRGFKDNKHINLKNPLSSYDFIYIDDVIDAIISATQLTYQSGIYNIGSGQSFKVINISKIIENFIYGEIGISQNILKKVEKINKEEVVNFWANVKNTNEAFNWIAKTSLKSGILKTIDTL